MDSSFWAPLSANLGRGHTVLRFHDAANDDSTFSISSLSLVWTVEVSTLVLTLTGPTASNAQPSMNFAAEPPTLITAFSFPTIPCCVMRSPAQLSVNAADRSHTKDRFSRLHREAVTHLAPDDNVAGKIDVADTQVDVPEDIENLIYPEADGVCLNLPAQSQLPYLPATQIFLGLGIAIRSLLNGAAVPRNWSFPLRLHALARE